MKKIIILLFVFSLPLYFSCEDFLDQTPQTTRSVASAYKTNADFKTAIVGNYAVLKDAKMYGNGGINSTMLWLTEVVSDNATYGFPKAASTISNFEIDEFNFNLANTIITSAYTGNYVGIGAANTILDKLPGANFDAALKNRYEGEARFLRAFFYFNLVRLFGDVQLVEHAFTDPYAANNLPRTEASKIYDLIIADLSFAESNLPASIPANEEGRASKWAAEALLAKVYLTRQNYELAATKLNEIITSGVFDITKTSYAATFNFATSYANNKDVIFGVYYKTGLMSQGSALWSDMVPASVSGSLFGTTSTGWGFMQPTADMENAYEPNDLRKGVSIATSYVAANGNTINVRYCVKYKQTGPQAGDADTDLPLLRYADVLLMYAECLNEQNQPSGAEPFLNQVRTRAGLTGKTGLDQSEMRLAIEQERRVELAFEGHRWYDLVRTNRYMDVMNAKGYNVKEYHKFYPIPQREIDLNPNLQQNPGYNQ